MVRNQRDGSSPFTVTNSEPVTSFNADTTTDTIQNNATAAIVLALQLNGTMSGTVS